jgi:hypothetical protein
LISSNVAMSALKSACHPRRDRGISGDVRPAGAANRALNMHADLRLKEKALARIAAPAAQPGRYRPDDTWLALLEAL